MKATVYKLPFLMMLGVCATLASSQAPKEPVPSVKPELRLSIVLDKEAYSPHERLLTRTRFTNISEETLCFPEPPQGEVDAVNGVLSTTVTRPDNTEDTEFLKIIDGRGSRAREKLIDDIKQRWIWLRPTQSYVTKSAGVQVTLSTLGRWQINMRYHPPEGSFKPVEYRKTLSSAAKSVGCTLPQVEIEADPVVFNVFQ